MVPLSRRKDLSWDEKDTFVFSPRRITEPSAKVISVTGDEPVSKLVFSSKMSPTLADPLAPAIFTPALSI